MTDLMALCLLSVPVAFFAGMFFSAASSNEAIRTERDRADKLEKTVFLAHEKILSLLNEKAQSVTSAKPTAKPEAKK